MRSQMSIDSEAIVPSTLFSDNDMAEKSHTYNKCCSHTNNTSVFSLCRICDETCIDIHMPQCILRICKKTLQADIVYKLNLLPNTVNRVCACTRTPNAATDAQNLWRCDTA